MTQISRRNLARMLGGGAAAAALAPFVPRSSHAGGTAAPRRLLVVFHGMGYLEHSFWPTAGASEEDFALGTTQAVLEPFRDQLIYPDGLALYGAPWYFPDDDNEHGTGSAMTFTASLKQGYATGPSFDQVIADHWWAQSQTAFRHIGLGVKGISSTHRACFFLGDQQPIVPQNSPTAAFDSLFAGLEVDPENEAAAARLRDQRGSVIDVVRSELTTVRNEIGTQEAYVLDQHLEHLRALEQRLVEFDPTCEVPLPPSPTGGDAGMIEAQMDIAIDVLACDLTSVATLQLGHCDGGITMFDGVSAHDVTHAVGDTGGDPGVLATHRDIDTWWAERWLHLLTRLDSIPEGDGTLLDNTLVVFGSDTTTGQSYSLGPHRHWRMPYFLAGGSNWAFPTGRYLKIPHPDGVSEDEFAQWPSNSRLLTSILQRAGLDVDTFGNMDNGSGPLPGL